MNGNYISILIRATQQQSTDNITIRTRRREWCINKLMNVLRCKHSKLMNAMNCAQSSLLSTITFELSLRSGVASANIGSRGCYQIIEEKYRMDINIVSGISFRKRNADFRTLHRMRANQWLSTDLIYLESTPQIACKIQLYIRDLNRNDELLHFCLPLHPGECATAARQRRSVEFIYRHDNVVPAKKYLKSSAAKCMRESSAQLRSVSDFKPASGFAADTLPSSNASGSVSTEIKY